MSRSQAAVCCVATFLLMAVPAQADMRTKPIRLVPEVKWDAAPTAVTVSGENNSDHEKAAEFFEAMNHWIREGFKKLDYTAQEDAELKFHWTLDIYDPGSAAKRWVVGFGAGTSHMQGTVTLEQGGEVVGSYAFSARPKTGGKRLAKEVGPILVLKIHQGGENAELHEYEKATKAEKKRAKGGG